MWTHTPCLISSVFNNIFNEMMKSRIISEDRLLAQRRVVPTFLSVCQSPWHVPLLVDRITSLWAPTPQGRVPGGRLGYKYPRLEQGLNIDMQVVVFVRLLELIRTCVNNMVSNEMWYKDIVIFHRPGQYG